MKKTGIILILLIALVECAFLSSRSTPSTHEKDITDRLVLQVDSFSAIIQNQLLPEAEKRDADSVKMRKLFLESRLAYKKFEWAVEYFNPMITRIVNGPPVPESQPTGLVQQPGGLQVVESYLYPYDAAKRTQIVRELKSVLSSCKTYKSYYQHATITNMQIWDACRLQAVRVITLCIAGFDAPLAKSGIDESAVSLRSIEEVLARYNSGDELNESFDRAIDFLRASSSFDSFNRAKFILQFGNPLTTAITQTQRKLNIQVVPGRFLLNPNAPTIFDEDAFDASAYAGYPEDGPMAERIALGKKLFNDPILSGDGTRSCATCHQANKAFADGLIKNKTFDGHGVLLRNTPTLFNAAFQPAQFADMRELTLEDQVKAVIENDKEMSGGSLAQVCNALSKKSDYAESFKSAFPKNKNAGIDKKELTAAIADYVRTLSILDSRFDEYMRGNAGAMNTTEVNGFNLFMGKARCGTCHYMPLFNGTLPPMYIKTDAEVLGVPAAMNSRVIDSDPGRNAITHATTDRYAFKIPTVRNAAQTAPYMHNGVFKTLEEVMDFYDEGGGVGMGLKVPNQTLDDKPLHLNDTEKSELIAFIKCLDNKAVKY